MSHRAARLTVLRKLETLDGKNLRIRIEIRGVNAARLADAKTAELNGQAQWSEEENRIGIKTKKTKVIRIRKTNESENIKINGL